MARMNVKDCLKQFLNRFVATPCEFACDHIGVDVRRQVPN